MHNIYSLLHQTSLNFPLCCPTLPLMLFVILLFGIKYYTMHCLCDVHKFHLGLGTCYLVLCDVNLLVNPRVVFVLYLYMFCAVLFCVITVLCLYCLVYIREVPLYSVVMIPPDMLAFVGSSAGFSVCIVSHLGCA